MDILSTAAKSTLKARLQVWIAYGLIGSAVVMGGFGVGSFVLYQRGKIANMELAQEVKKQENRVAVVEAANKTQAEAIDAIKAANQVSDTLLGNLDTTVRGLQANNKNVMNQLASVRETNEAARKYLAAAVPSAVGCVLDQTCVANANDVSEAKRGLDAAVQSATDKAEQNKSGRDR